MKKLRGSRKGGLTNPVEGDTQLRLCLLWEFGNQFEKFGLRPSPDGSGTRKRPRSASQRYVAVVLSSSLRTQPTGSFGENARWRGGDREHALESVITSGHPRNSHWHHLWSPRCLSNDPVIRRATSQIWLVGAS